jgi:hypothetical protein
MQLEALLAIAGRADAVIEAGEFIAQQGLQLAAVGGHHRHHCREALGPGGAKGRIGQGGRHLADHRLGHQALAGLVPLQAGGKRRVEPPADPLHRCGQAQGLGDRQPPGPAGVGGIQDHRRASGHGLAEALVQQGFNVTPGALHGRVTKELAAHHIGGEHHRTGELGQHPGQGGLAAGGRADQQMAAQGRWQGRNRRTGHGRSVAAGACHRKALQAKEQMLIPATTGI